MINNKKIAYLIQAHKNPEQINIFLKQMINTSNCDIYIHVSKSNENIISKIIKRENIYIFSEFNVRWGSFEIVKAAILLMKEATKKYKYDYIYFGSGQDLLIRSDLEKFLSKINEPKAFIKIKGVISEKSREASRYNVCWDKKMMVREDFHILRFVRIIISFLYICKININKNQYKLLDGWRIYEGHTWFLISGEIGEYIIKFLEENKEYELFWEKSLASDLMFFQTIIMNSKYKNCIEEELMYLNFGTKFSDMNHPYDLKMKDIENIEKSEKFFARKFDIHKDKDIIDYFYEKLK